MSCPQPQDQSATQTTQAEFQVLIHAFVKHSQEANKTCVYYISKLFQVARGPRKRKTNSLASTSQLVGPRNERRTRRPRTKSNATITAGRISYSHTLTLFLSLTLSIEWMLHRRKHVALWCTKPSLGYKVLKQYYKIYSTMTKNVHLYFF